MPTQERELKSWKEIAHHLGVNVRTAQKWEQERHLPIKRPPGGKGPVHATITALDEWKTSTTKQDTTESWFRWPVAPGVTAEVRFIGAPVTPTTIEVLREYLNVYNKVGIQRQQDAIDILDQALVAPVKSKS